MKILIFGRGVIGTQYAWALEQANNDITFYIRPERIAQYGNKIQLDVLDGRISQDGQSVKVAWEIKMIAEIPEDHNFDLIIISVQHYNFKQVASYLSTRVGNATLFIFNNFWNEPLEETAILPQEQLVWGFPRAGGGFDASGVLKGAFMNNIFLGTFKTTPGNRHQKLVELFEHAGFKTEHQPDFRSWLFIHFAFSAARLLAAFNDKLELPPVEQFESSHFWKEVKLNVAEIIPLLEARNVNLEASLELKLLDHPHPVKIIGEIPRTVKLIITAHANPYELKAICHDVLQTARHLKIEMKRFEAGEKKFRQ